jgi:hypothetical protein
MKTYQFQYEDKKGWQNRPNPQLIDSEKTLILAFCSPFFKQQPQVFKELKKNFPKSLIVGCSTSGEILGSQIFDMTISCTAICFESAELHFAIHPLELTSHSFDTGKKLAQSMIAPNLKGVILLSDGLVANGSLLIEGFNSQIDSKKVSVSGGLAGDGSQFKDTWILVNDEIKNHCALAVGLSGDNLLISSSSKGGWDIFGPERLITRSIDNIVYEIDGKPALDLYKEYLGDKAKDLPASGLLFPIQIRSNATDEKRLVRTILGIDEKEKSLTFAGSVPQGYLTQLMRANFDRVIDGASDAAEVIKNHLQAALQTTQPVQNDPTFCLAVSCIGRRLVLGARSEEEVEVLMSSLGPHTAISGFYSYGELAPSLQGGPCDLHNQSMTLMNIYESKSQIQKRVA